MCRDVAALGYFAFYIEGSARCPRFVGNVRFILDIYKPLILFYMS